MNMKARQLTCNSKVRFSAFLLWFGERKLLLIIAAMTIAARLFLFFLIAPWIAEIEKENLLTGDSYYYNLAAKNIISHGVLSVSESVPVKLDAHLTPGYPLFIACHYILFGIKPWTVLLSQILLQGLFVIGIFILAKQIKLPVFSAAAGSVIFALDPTAMMMPNTLLTESVFGIFIAYTVIFLIKYRERFESKYIFFSSFLLSIAIYFKPGSRFLIPVLAAIILIVFNGQGYSKRIRACLLFIIVPVIILFPWAARNLFFFKHAGMSYHVSLHLRNHAVNALIEAKGITTEEAEKVIGRGLSLSGAEGLNPWDRYDKEARLYKSFIKQNFLYWVKASLRDEALIYIIPGSSRYASLFHGASLNNKITNEIFLKPADKGLMDRIKSILDKKGAALSVFILITILFNLAVLFFGFMGAVEIFKLDRSIFYVLFTVFLSFALSVGPFLDPRFKFPSFWILALFSGAGIYFALSRRTARNCL